MAPTNTPTISSFAINPPNNALIRGASPQSNTLVVTGSSFNPNCVIKLADADGSVGDTFGPVVIDSNDGSTIAAHFDCRTGGQPAWPNTGPCGGGPPSEFRIELGELKKELHRLRVALLRLEKRLDDISEEGPIVELVTITVVVTITITNDPGSTTVSSGFCSQSVPV